MSAQSAHTASGTSPTRISSAKIWHPTQNANTDSSVAAPTRRTSSASVAVSAPKPSARTAAVVVIAAPIP
jgi:hypothetical protein